MRRARLPARGLAHGSIRSDSRGTRRQGGTDSWREERPGGVPELWFDGANRGRAATGVVARAFGAALAMERPCRLHCALVDIDSSFSAMRDASLRTSTLSRRRTKQSSGWLQLRWPLTMDVIHGS